MSLTINNYEYVNEDTIDDQLICIICSQPFQSPVSFDCKHTFCQLCIDTWIKQNTSCPVCRRQYNTGYTLTKVTTSKICNELDCLLVRCLRCNKNSIERKNFNKHFQRCSKNRMKTASNLFRNRWHSLKKMIRVRHHHRQATVADAEEVVNTNHEQRGTFYRELLDAQLRGNQQQLSNLYAHFPGQPTFPSAAVARPFERIPNAHVQEVAKWKIKTILYFCIVILVTWLLMKFWRAITIIIIIRFCIYLAQRN